MICLENLKSNTPHFPVSCYWFIEDLRYYCRTMMVIIFLLIITLTVVLLMLHIMKSANESSDLVHNYQQITTNSGNLLHFKFLYVLQTTKLLSNRDGNTRFFKMKRSLKLIQFNINFKFSPNTVP